MTPDAAALARQTRCSDRSPHPAADMPGMNGATRIGPPDLSFGSSRPEPAPPVRRSDLRNDHAPVSLAIGLRSVDAVVLATDSRTTGTFGTRDDRTKLHVVGNCALLACVGDDEIADAISLERCISPKGQDVDAPAVFSELWRARFAVVQATTAARHVDAIVASKDRRLHLISTRGEPTFVNESVCWAGVLRNAAFLAESYWRPDLDADQLARLAVATIHETARVRPEAGGRIQVGILDADGPRLLGSTDVEQIRSAWVAASASATAYLLRSAHVEDSVAL